MKKILILDNTSFSYICASILKLHGHKSVIAKNLRELRLRMDENSIDLIIANYHVTNELCDSMKDIAVPKLLLCAHINRDVVSMLENIKNAYCMIKPIDYSKFMDLIREIRNYKNPQLSGYSIL